MILASTSSGTAPIISVAIYPGAMQLTVIFLEADSRAKALVKLIIAALAAQ